MPNTDSNTVKPKWKVYIILLKCEMKADVSLLPHAKHCAHAEWQKKNRAALLSIWSKGGSPAGSALSWAASHSPHLDPVKHTSSQTFIPQLHCGASASGWVKHQRRKGSLNTCLRGTVREFQVLGITFPELFRLLLCALGGKTGA